MNAVLKIVLQRLGLGLITLFVVSLIIFVAILMLPGGFAEAILGQAATPETVAAFNKEIGLDQPAIVRYFNWIAGVLQGDFGTSYASRIGYRREVAELLAPRAFNTSNPLDTWANSSSFRMDRNAGKRYDLVVAGMVMIGLIGLGLDLLVRQMEKLDQVRWGLSR